MEGWEFDAELWEYSGKGSWHFLTIPPDIGFAVRSETEGRRGGWGMVAVIAEIGGSRFETSIFPDKASGSYLLPVKAAVRKAEKARAGDLLRVRFRLAG